MADHKALISVQSIGETSPIVVEVAELLLSEDELDRASKYQFDTHRNRFIRGRAFLRTFLGNQLETDPKAIEFGYGKRGKPAVKHSTPLAFNLSHSGDTAIVACSDSLLEIGVDLELLDRRVDYASLCRNYFNPREIDWILNPALSEPEQKRRFLEVWTAKEARMKLFGDGLYLEPISIEVSFEGNHPNQYLAPTTPHLSSFYTNQFQEAVGAITATEDFELVWLK